MKFTHQDGTEFDSLLELSLYQQIIDCGILTAKVHYRLIEGRRFEWDFAFPQYKLLVEVQGQIHCKGGHNTGSGLIRDYTKNNLAVQAGWRTLFFWREAIENGEAIQFLQEVIYGR